MACCMNIFHPADGAFINPRGPRVVYVLGPLGLESTFEIDDCAGCYKNRCSAEAENRHQRNITSRHHPHNGPDPFFDEVSLKETLNP